MECQLFRSEGVQNGRLDLTPRISGQPVPVWTEGRASPLPSGEVCFDTLLSTAGPAAGDKAATCRRVPPCVQPLSQIPRESRALTSLSRAGPLNCNPGPAVAGALGGRSLPAPPPTSAGPGGHALFPAGPRPSASLWSEAAFCSASTAPGTGCPSSAGSGWQLSLRGRADGRVLRGPGAPASPGASHHPALSLVPFSALSYAAMAKFPTGRAPGRAASRSAHAGLVHTRFWPYETHRKHAGDVPSRSGRLYIPSPWLSL